MSNLKKWLSQRLSGTEGTAADDADGFRLAVAALIASAMVFSLLIKPKAKIAAVGEEYLLKDE